MKRKLRNSLAGVYASAAVLALGLAVAQPHGSLRADAASAGAPPTVEAAAGTVAAPAARSPRRAARPVRRHTFVMPYFSFTPRG